MQGSIRDLRNRRETVAAGVDGGWVVGAPPAPHCRAAQADRG